MIKVYGPRMGSAFRNHWLLHEVNADYDAVPVDMKNGEHKKPDFLKLNPNGQVPVMTEDDFVLTESLAINNYLAEKFNPALLGDGPRNRALVWKWSLWTTYTMQKHFGVAMMQIWTGSNDQSIIAKEMSDSEKYLQMLDDALIGQDFLVGNTFSLADINVGVTMMYCDFLKYDYQKFTNVARWMRTLQARTAYIAAKEEK